MTQEIQSTDLTKYPQPRAAGCPFDPGPALQAEQQTGGLTALELWDGSTTWLATRHADVKALLGDPRVSADPMKPGYPHQSEELRPTEPGQRLFLLMDDPDHAWMRQMVTAPFSVRNTRSMQPYLDELINGLVDELEAGPQPADFVEAFALPLPSLVICELLGVPYTERTVFQETTRVMVDNRASVEEQTSARGELIAYLAELFGRKVHDPGDDLYSKLYTDRVATGEITSEDAIGMALMLLVAGHETTANMTAMGLLTLFHHPEQFQDLRDNLDQSSVLDGFIEELMRYQTIIHDPRRRAVTEDIQFGDQLIRAGDGLILPLDIANRDPQVFQDPDAFDIRRDARRQIGFGFGPHQCLGQQLARLEMKTAFRILLTRLPGISPAVDLSELEFKDDSLVYGVNALPVRW